MSSGEREPGLQDAAARRFGRQRFAVRTLLFAADLHTVTREIDDGTVQQTQLRAFWPAGQKADDIRSHLEESWIQDVYRG